MSVINGEMKAIRRRWQCNAVVCYTLSRGCLRALSIMGRKLPGCPTSRMMSCSTVPGTKSNILVFRSQLLKDVHVPEFEINNTAIDRVLCVNIGHCINDYNCLMTMT